MKGEENMKVEAIYEEKQIYILANDEIARKNLAISLVKSAIVIDSNAIFICYHLQDDIVLLHIKPYYGKKSIFEAMQMLKTDLLFETLNTQDTALREILNEPNFSTRETLLNFLDEEINT